MVLGRQREHAADEGLGLVGIGAEYTRHEAEVEARRFAILEQAVQAHGLDGGWQRPGSGFADSRRSNAR